jgi:hypothetical protein
MMSGEAVEEQYQQVGVRGHKHKFLDFWQMNICLFPVVHINACGLFCILIPTHIELTLLF